MIITDFLQQNGRVKSVLKPAKSNGTEEEQYPSVLLGYGFLSCNRRIKTQVETQNNCPGMRFLKFLEDSNQ
jgi:hypothetical protein